MSNHDSFNRTIVDEVLPTLHTKRFDRVVIMLVDALRFDYTVFDESVPVKKWTNFQNRMPIIARLRKEYPDRSRLFRFVADPPTVTMQRLKALVTGGLPTFMEIKSNFESDAISEDNIIFQLRRMGKNVTFMGDDTWMRLFPDSLTTSYPFPSFQVADLHTVDKGCFAHLIPELRKNDASLLIAHFLGVDHIGHTFSTNHVEMSAKLRSINDFIGLVVNEIDASDQKTLLLVMGDHGATPDGNHGGTTLEETTSALFVYSTDRIGESKVQNGACSIGDKSSNDPSNPNVPWLFKLHQDSVNSICLSSFPVVQQVDLVPTVALLMGLPIPFANVGKVISEFFPFVCIHLDS